MPPVLFGLLLLFQDDTRLRLNSEWPYLPRQFGVVGVAGTVATLGGSLAWRYHRSPRHLKIPNKERAAEALGLMSLAMLHHQAALWLGMIVVMMIYRI